MYLTDLWKSWFKDFLPTRKETVMKFHHIHFMASPPWIKSNCECLVSSPHLFFSFPHFVFIKKAFLPLLNRVNIGKHRAACETQAHFVCWLVAGGGLKILNASKIMCLIWTSLISTTHRIIILSLWKQLVPGESASLTLMMSVSGSPGWCLISFSLLAVKNWGSSTYSNEKWPLLESSSSSSSSSSSLSGDKGPSSV